MKHDWFAQKIPNLRTPSIASNHTYAKEKNDVHTWRKDRQTNQNQTCRTAMRLTQTRLKVYFFLGGESYLSQLDKKTTTTPINRKRRVFNNGTPSYWAPVASEVPQDSVLEKVLHIIYINDIDVGLSNFISKFADDTKIGNTIIDDHDRLSLQEDLRKRQKISVWSERWEMALSCQQMPHFTSGYKKPWRKKLIIRWMALNSIADNALKILALRLRRTWNSPSNANMKRGNPVEWWVL